MALGAERVRVDEETEHEVGGRDAGVSTLLGFGVGGHDDVLGPRGEAAEVGVRIELRGDAEVLREEALAGGLLGDAHGPADVGPRRAGPAGLVDEVADEVVGHVAEVVGGDHRARSAAPARRRGPCGWPR